MPLDVSRVALVSSAVGRVVDPDLPLAVEALGRLDVAATCELWDDAAVDWSAYDLVVVRSCWDYTWRCEEFLGWARKVPRIANPVPVLEWSSDKRYVADLARWQVPVVPTVWDPTAPGGLPEADEWVVKPALSASARDTARWATTGEVLAHATALREVGRTVMVQPYLRAVDVDGETAMLYLGGRFSHAVRKGPLLAAGEGVRQDRDSRVDLAPRTATPAQLATADAALAAVRQHVPGGAELLYARVDLVDGPDGTPQVLELELAEPSLFLPQAPGAADRFAAAVAGRLSRVD